MQDVTIIANAEITREQHDDFCRVRLIKTKQERLDDLQFLLTRRHELNVELEQPVRNVDEIAADLLQVANTITMIENYLVLERLGETV